MKSTELIVLRTTRNEMLREWIARFLVARVLRPIQRSHRRKNMPKFWLLPSDSLSEEIIASGLYEKALCLIIRNHFEIQPNREHMVMLDVGANIGNHCVYFSQLFGRIFAFEPNPTVGAVLKANLMLNRIENVVQLAIGLGEIKGSIPFEENTVGNLGGSKFVFDGKPSSQNRKLLPIEIADHIVPPLLRSNEVIAFVKIDIEGAEPGALRGMRQILSAHKPLVAFEISNMNHGEQTMQVLREVGYTRFVEPRWINSDSKLAKLTSTLLNGVTWRLNEVTTISNCWHPIVFAIHGEGEPFGCAQ